MASVITLDELRARVRFLGDFQNSRLGQTSLAEGEARLLEVINANIRKVWDLLLRFRPDAYVVRQGNNPATTANLATVALAADFYRLRQVEISDGGTWHRLRPVNLSEGWRYQRASSAPTNLRYRVEGSNLVLAPTPTAVHSLRIFYLPAFEALRDPDPEDEEDEGVTEFDGINGYEDLVIARCIVDLKMREGMAAGEWMTRVEQLTREVQEAAGDLDAGEPFYLSGGADIDDEVWR